MNGKRYLIENQGSALSTVLILLFISSTLAVSIMQGASLEYKISTNAIQSKAVFQAAESATEQALNSINSFSTSYDEGIDGHHEIELDLDDFSQVEGSASIQYVGGGIVPGSSAGVFEGLRFEVHGTANINDEVRAGVTQGALRVAPAIN